MNKKEIKRTAVRRRGTTIAAAALSVALVAPFVHPVVAPQSAAEAQAQTSGTVAATPITDPSKLIEADGIANGYVKSRFGMTNALATLSGVVGLKETTASSSLKGTMGINDATVYMQFKDRDGTISPIFATKSHQLGDTSGNYVFDLRAKDEKGNVLSHPDSEVPGGEYSFVDANGKPHLFRALRGQEYRIWVDSPLKNEETGNDLTYVRQAGGGVPGAWAPVTQGSANGAFYFENYNMQRTGVFLEERAPSVDEKSYMVSPDFSMDEEGWHQPEGTAAPRYSYFGRVWSDAEGGPDRNETGPLYQWKGDQPIEGAKVYASVLSDEGIAEFERLAIADKPFREQAAATKAMIENMRANGKEPILKTVGAETDAEGRYTIRMGEDVGNRMKNFTYIWAENDGKVLNSFSGFPTPVFQKVNDNAGENPNWGGAVGIPSYTNQRWYNINFAEVQADIAHLDIVNYDSYLNPADLPEGINNLEPAQIKLTGALPFSGDNKIRWIGPDGKKIGEDCAVNTLADAANCSLAPEKFATPGTYVAQLVNAYDVVVGQDSFIAVDKVRQNGEFEPQYKDTTAPTGEKTTVEAPKDKDGQEIPDGTTYSSVGQVTDPEGNKVDKPEWITVNPDGSIVVEPPADAKTGDYKIPVLVTYPDGSRETIEAKVTVKEPEASDKTTVDDSNVKPVDPTDDPQDSGIKVENKDDDTKISAKDEDGNDVPVEIDEDGKVIVTPGEDVDGPITVVVEDPDLPDGKVEVEVPVNGHEKDRDDNGSDEQPEQPGDDKTTVDDSNVKPVDPTDDPQDSGIKVENKDDDTKISAKDEDGNDVPVEIDEDGKVIVTPGEDVDGPITVVVEDPDLPDGKVEVEVPVNGHEKDRDDNGSDEQPEQPGDDKTTVDDSNVKPVDPTDDPQDSGIKVENKDDDTKISAKDEDGNDVPVEIDEDGKVIVTPGEDVDGPIKVVVEDPDLPNGKTEVEVPVNGHEKDRDDNGSDEQPEQPGDGKTTVDDSNVKPVDPTDDPQDSGIKVENKDDDTKISAKDEDGNDVPVEIDEDGKVIVTPGEDVDGPIKVVVEDPDLPNGKTEVEVPVNGHEKDRDDNGSDEQPEQPGDDKTTVDDSNVKPVDPTDDPQDSGIKVENKDDDTKISAKDEDGNDVPVEIDEDGKVIVTPGEDVDGPIKVVVEDPDLPNGKTEIEVPVNGHEKDRDDNGSDEQPEQPGDDKTTVDDSNVKPVDPTDDPQDSGIKVENKDDDTKISAKDEDGNDVPVKIDEDGKVIVTPGEDVDGPIKVVVEDPDLPNGKTEIEVPVNGHEKDRDDNGSDKKPHNPGIPGGPSWPIDPNKPGEDEKPGDEDKVTKPSINPVTEDDKEISGTGKPGTDITVVITDKDGNETEKTVTVGDDGKWKVVVDKDLKAGDKITATDSDGKKAEATVKAKPSKPGSEPDDSSDWTGSSNLSERCINTGLGIGIPLLFLIPVGLASQMNIPGLSEFVAPINKQIQDLNTRLQQQAGVFNGPLADQVNGINAQLKRFGADYQQAAGAVALIAAGALAIGLLADACAPGAGEGSSK